MAAYDVSLIDKEYDVLVLRKDLLDEFLSRTGLYLIWLSMLTKNTKTLLNEWLALGVYGAGHFGKKVRNVK